MTTSTDLNLDIHNIQNPYRDQKTEKTADLDLSRDESAEEDSSSEWEMENLTKPMSPRDNQAAANNQVAEYLRRLRADMARSIGLASNPIQNPVDPEQSKHLEE